MGSSSQHLPLHCIDFHHYSELHRYKNPDFFKDFNASLINEAVKAFKTPPFESPFILKSAVLAECSFAPWENNFLNSCDPKARKQKCQKLPFFCIFVVCLPHRYPGGGTLMLRRGQMGMVTHTTPPSFFILTFDTMM
ncbi:hypothetical protein ILYODFUR_028337 [Ilyodon furcidens]|uniref:Uncharacterized protein n=1 Tax=Ilyodon furcidens TaxID=33524 RepID=A0ABV0UDB9_9TELE